MSVARPVGLDLLRLLTLLTLLAALPVLAVLGGCELFARPSRAIGPRRSQTWATPRTILAVTVTVRVDGAKAPERVTLHFFETSRGFRFTPRP